MSKEIIISMDLSLSFSAYAVSKIKNSKVVIIEIRYTDNTSNKVAKLSHGEKLTRIANDIAELLIDYEGTIGAVVREKGFSRYQNTTQTLFKVVGVSDQKIYETVGITRIEELAPTTVKKLVTGTGTATKEDVAKAIKNFLLNDITFKTNDCSDAVAVGIAWMIKNNLLEDLYE